MSALVFWIPKPPDTGNPKRHPMVVHRERKTFLRELTQRQQLKHGFPAVPSVPIAGATLGIEFRFSHAGHRPDRDNLIRWLKPAIDFLVRCGYLAADDPDTLRLSDPEYVRGFDGAPPLCTVKLTLTPTAPGAA